MTKSTAPPIERVKIRGERAELLHHMVRLTDKVMIALAFIWIALMIGDFLGKLNPPLVILNNVIWGVFVLDFAVKFAVAPHKLHFLRTHWIIVISLILPAFRLLRIFQAISALRALSLIRILTSLNRGMGALAEAMGRRGVGYVILVTIIALFGGAAGMYSFERPSQLVLQGFADVAKQGGGLHSYSDAVWWTAMLMTTIGSQYWPVTMAGRALCFLLSLFSLGVFGFITAALASFFVDRGSSDAANTAAPPSQPSNADLYKELHDLRAALESYVAKSKADALRQNDH